MGSQHLINERTGRRDDFLLVFFYAQARMWKFAANAAWGRAESGGEGHFPTRLSGPMQRKHILC